MKILIFFSLCLSTLYVAAQDTVDVNWTPRSFKAIAANETVLIDQLENLYVSENGSINKYDSTGTLRFSQSIKSLGEMTDLVAVNTMKLVYFSEDQQTLCYFDNTLTPVDDCLELYEREIENAAFVSRSNQPNKMWVLDNLNSTLSLLALDGTSQGQEIPNLRGILAVDEVIQLRERANVLYLVAEGRGVYVFDLYGSLIEFKELPAAKYIDATENSLFVLVDGFLHIYSVLSSDSLVVKLPVENVQSLDYVNQSFFLRTDAGVHKFDFQISE